MEDKSIPLLSLIKASIFLTMGLGAKAEPQRSHISSSICSLSSTVIEVEKLAASETAVSFNASSGHVKAHLRQ
jgi:hypothetical protein